jgi:hypothetical protein
MNYSMHCLQRSWLDATFLVCSSVSGHISHSIGDGGQSFYLHQGFRR